MPPVLHSALCHDDHGTQQPWCAAEGLHRFIRALSDGLRHGKGGVLEQQGKDDGWITVHFGKGDLLNSCNSSDQGIQSVMLQELEELTLQVLSNNKIGTSLPAPRCIHSPLHVTHTPQTTSLLKVQLAGLIGGATLTDILQKDLPGGYSLAEVMQGIQVLKWDSLENDNCKGSTVMLVPSDTLIHPQLRES